MCSRDPSDPCGAAWREAQDEATTGPAMTISPEDQQIADALAFVRDMLGFDPATPPNEMIRYCILNQAAQIEMAQHYAVMHRDATTEGVH